MSNEAANQGGASTENGEGSQVESTGNQTVDDIANILANEDEQPKKTNNQAGEDGDNDRDLVGLEDELGEGAAFAEDDEGDDGEGDGDDTDTDGDDEGEDGEGDDESGDSDENDDGESDDEGGQELEFSTLEDLAEAADMSEEEILSLVKTKIKVQGKEIEVTFDDLKKGHMLESDYRQKTTDLANERKTFSEEKETGTKVLKENLQNSLGVFQLLVNQYVGDEKKLAELKASGDTDDFLLMQSEMQERAKQLKQMQAALKNQNDEVTKQEQSKLKESILAFAKEQRENMNTLVPSWIDEKVADKEQTAMRKYLKSSFPETMAFTDEEIDQIGDARITSIILKAMKFDQLEDTGKLMQKKAKKQVRKLKAGAGKQGQKNKRAIAKGKKAQAKKSGSLNDAASAIEGML